MNTPKPPLGEYEHYKNKRYEVIGVATNTETLEKMVVYRALYGEKQLWLRPLDEFVGDVEIDGKKIPRFRRVG